MNRRTLLGLTVLIVSIVLILVVMVIFIRDATRDAPASGANPPSAEVVWSDPLTAVELQAVARDLALRSLAGEPPDVSAEQAMLVGELETAYVNVVFSPEIGDARRAGLMLALANRYYAAGEAERAVRSLWQAHDIAVLSPSLSEPRRIEVMLQAAQLWASLGNQEEAILSLDQARIIVANGHGLQPAQRRQWWQRLSDEYGELGQAARSEEAAAQASLPQMVSPPFAAFPEPVLQRLEKTASLPADVAEIVGQRQERARRVVEVLMVDLNADITPEAADLGEFLRREDVARATWYEQGRNEPDFAARAGMAREEAHWLAIKYQIAVGGFGLNLVPEWEVEVPVIRAALVSIYGEWSDLIGTQVAALPGEEDARWGQLEFRRRQILLGRLGLYPDVQEEPLVAALLDAVETLRLHGQLGSMKPVVTGEADRRVFLFAENR